MFSTIGFPWSSVSWPWPLASHEGEGMNTPRGEVSNSVPAVRMARVRHPSIHDVHGHGSWCGRSTPPHVGTDGRTSDQYDRLTDSLASIFE